MACIFYDKPYVFSHMLRKRTNFPWKSFSNSVCTGFEGCVLHSIPKCAAHIPCCERGVCRHEDAKAENRALHKTLKIPCGLRNSGFRNMLSFDEIHFACRRAYGKRHGNEHKNNRACTSSDVQARTAIRISIKIFYQMCARLSAGTKSLSPSLIPKAVYQASIIGSAAFTRRLLGEWTSLFTI